MTDAPRLPDSPLTELHVPALPPDVQRWRTRARWLGGALSTLYGLGVGAVVTDIMLIGLGGALDLEMLSMVMVFSAPVLLLGLMLGRLAARWGRWSRAVGVVTVMVALLLGAGHVYVLLAALDDAGAVAYGVAMLVADAALLLVGALGGHRFARAASIAATAAVMVAAVAMVIQLAPDWQSLGGPADVLFLAAIAGVPLVAASATAWLAFTVPLIEAGDVNDV